MRILHVIHDFLPRHQAGSELYALGLCGALAERHELHVLCAEYDPAQAHGTLVWREVDGIPVTELVNNWAFRSFADTYSSARLGRLLGHVLDAIQPDILHIHSLLNLSFELPRLARARGIPSVATAHDFTLLCPSGGQRYHTADQHVCFDIEPERCARCFSESPFRAQMGIGRAAGGGGGRLGLATRAAARVVRRWAPGLAGAAVRSAQRLSAPGPTADDIEARLAAARAVFHQVELLVAPSASLARELTRFGCPPSRLRVMDYGFPALAKSSAGAGGTGSASVLRFGFVGTLARHKGAHLMLAALRELREDRYEVHVFGDPSTFPAYGGELRRAAVGLPVRFRGAFPHQRRAEAYGSIDVLIVPSVWPENSPLVVHEAFQAGVPVVGARIGGIPELVVDGRGGLLFEAGSVRDLASVLTRLVDDRGLVSRLAASVPPVRSIADDAVAWEGFYGEALGQRAVAAGG